MHSRPKLAENIRYNSLLKIKINKVNNKKGARLTTNAKACLKLWLGHDISSIQILEAVSSRKSYQVITRDFPKTKHLGCLKNFQFKPSLN